MCYHHSTILEGSFGPIILEKKKLKNYILVTLILILGLVTYVVLHIDEPKLRLYFFDVGQGDALLIETPNKFQVLVDAGPDRSVVRHLGKTFSFSDRSIDLVIATHPDHDHIGGMLAVFDRYDVKSFLEPNIYSDNGTYLALQQKVEDEDSNHIVLDRTQTHVIDGVTFRFLFPDRDASEFNANLGSIVLQVVYGEHEFLLMGDAPKSIEKFLLQRYGSELESDVLKVGHHGSKTSTDKNFVDVVNPKYAIISAGHDNRYGHPHDIVLENLEGVEVLETKDGTILFETDGRELLLK